jgi:hypothetical protein
MSLTTSCSESDEVENLLILLKDFRADVLGNEHIFREPRRDKHPDRGVSQLREAS